MNDEFLYRIRTEPPPHFVKRLKRRLEEQARRLAARWSITRAVFTGLLVGGTAFAAAWWMVGRPPTTAMAPGSEQVATTTQPLQSRLRTARVPETSVARGEPHPELGGGALGTGPLPPDDRVALSKGPGDAPPARSGGVAIGPATTVAGPVAAPEARFGIRILAAPTTYNLAKVVKDQWMRNASAVMPAVDELHIERAFETFCRGTRVNSAEIVIASRRIDSAEFARCQRNGVTNILESKIGYQAVVLAGPKVMPSLELEPRHVFLALARRVPDPAEPSRLVDNPFLAWADIEPTLDPRHIDVLGPTPLSSTRKLFVELVMEAGCDTYPWIAALKRSDAERYAEICHTLRDDGVYRAVEPGPALSAKARWSESYALELLSYDYYANYGRELLSNQLRGVAPTSAGIASGEYAAARPVYVYADNARVDRIPEGRLVLSMYLNERIISSFLRHELIPLSSREWAVQRQRQAIPLTRASD